MSYSLYEIIKKSRFENCVILTYGLNIKYYESLFWMWLYRNGCHNNIIFMDGSQYFKSLRQEKSSIYRLGSGYTICPVYTLSAFHPKIILLTTKRSGKLIVGSANITASAFTQNRELVNEFNFEIGKDEEYLYLFNDCWNYLLRISDGVPSFIDFQLRQMIRISPWLSENGQRKNDIVFISYPNSDENNKDKVIDILSQELSKVQVKELCVLSPFFDIDMRIIIKFEKRFNLKKFNIITNQDTIFDPSCKSIIEKKVNLYKFDSSVEGVRGKKLHGKACYFKTSKSDYLLCGSMNFTSRALALEGEVSNYEAGILYKGGEKEHFDELGLSSMITEKNRIDFKEIKFEKVPKGEEKVKEGEIALWAEYRSNILDLFFFNGKFIEEIQTINLKFIDNLDNLIKEINYKSFLSKEDKISVLNIDKDIIERSMYIDINLFFKDGTTKECQISVINKIDILRDAIFLSPILKRINSIIEGREGVAQDNDLLAQLLNDYLFETLEDETDEPEPKTIAGKENKVDIVFGKEGKLEKEDIVSIIPSRLKKSRLNIYSGISIDIIKNLFIRTFLEPSEKQESFHDEIDKEFVEGRDLEILKEEISEESLGFDDEVTEEVQDEKDKEEELKKVQEEKKKEYVSKKFQNKLRKKYCNHLGELEKRPHLINIENECVRHFAVFWMLTKNIKDEYSLLKKEEDFKVEDYLSYITSLLTNNIGRGLTDFISSKHFIYGKSFCFGFYSFLTNYCFIDKKLEKIIEDRLFRYEKRREDLLWIINRLLLLSYISRFDYEGLNQEFKLLRREFEKLKTPMGKAIQSIEFGSVLNQIEMARDVASELNLNDSLWKIEYFINNNFDRFKTGDLVFIKNQGPGLVRKHDSEYLEVYCGFNLYGTIYKLDNSLKSQNIHKLNIQEKTIGYFRELLSPDKSLWYYE